MHTWIPPISEICERDQFASTHDEATYRMMHPLLLPDGKLVFHGSPGATVCLEPNGKIAWIAKVYSHHSLELNHDGNIVVCTNQSVPYTDTKSFLGSGYAIVSPDGQILEERSFVDIFLDNDLEPLLMATFKQDIFHLNDLHPINRDVGLSKKGDIAFSMHGQSLVGLYRPSTNKIIWYKIGPWIGQHDISLLGDGSFSVFDNYGGHFRKRHKNNNFRIMIHDSGMNKTYSKYAEVIRKYNMVSQAEGRVRILENGDAIIEANMQGKIFRINNDEVLWQYENRLDDGKTFGKLNWSRYLTSDEIDLSWLK
ncbi:MAG: hypothetical protein GY710_02760 [Desulfobacteraceae bacterium]|nr:hypothetical protein [Desulfobacteraceae bacterium]